VARHTLCALVAGLLACTPLPRVSGVQPAGALSVGVARIDITPDEPIRLTGYGNRTAPAERVKGRLWAKALAFGEGGQAAVLISADLIGVPREMTEEIAGRLRSAGLARQQITVAATHTHTGPSLTGVLPFIFPEPLAPEQRAVVDRYSGTLLDRLEHVARAALDDRRPSTVAWGRGTAGFAANRRVLTGGKWTAFGVDPTGAVDHDLPVMAVRGLDGTLRAVLASYACHATTLEGRDNFVHGDWPGVAQALIEQRHPGATAMITIGTGADANPDPRGGGLPDVERHARAIAGEVDRVLASSLRPVSSGPSGRFRYLDLSFGRTPGEAEWREQAQRTDAGGLYARAVLEQLARGEALARTVPYPVQTWTFGTDLAMVFLGGEVVADYGLRLKRELDGARLWVHAYSNDVAFYVPSRRMIAEGGYEVDRSMVYYGQPARLAEETEDQIVNAVGELLTPAFRRQTGN